MAKHKFLAVLALALVGGACINATSGTDEDTTTSSAAGASSTASFAPPSLSPATGTPTAKPTEEPTPTAEAVAATGEQIDVARVIDGDTFELADGRTVRLLGIDSCEMETYGGEQAKVAAESQLDNPYNEPITMTAEDGVDTDRYGRLLRYVSLSGTDLGEFLVKYDHTGVYQGENDASQDYLDRLYESDLDFAANPPSGRECGDPNADVDVPAPDYDSGDHNMRDGALTGGYCARKWWC